MRRCPTVRNVENDHLDVCTGAERDERLRLLRFAFSAAARQHQPPYSQSRLGRGQCQQRATHADRNVVAMCADDCDLT